MINDYGVNVFPQPHNCSEQIIYTIKILIKSAGILLKGNFVGTLMALICLHFMISPR